MSIYLNDTMYAIQTLINTSTTNISNSEIIKNTFGLRNKINRIIDYQTIGNKI